MTSAALASVGGRTRQRRIDLMSFKISFYFAGVAGVVKSTLGATSAPAVAVKYGFSLNPKEPAYTNVGKLLVAVLYRCTTSLYRPRSTEIRFSVPSNCA